jgi:hypothetical protein
MASSRRVLLLATLQAVALASFDPKPFHHYAEKAEEKGTKRFSHAESHLLPGGTALTLSWSADADPDTIMGLDTEHAAGVRLADCKPNQLVLHLPASHVGSAKAWKHVTASQAIHNCAHLEDHPLYHRIEGMEFTKHPDTPKGGATVVLNTKELYSISEVLPNVDFKYAVTPIDSLHPDEQEAAKAYWAQQAELKSAKSKEHEEELEARRLQAAGLPAGGIESGVSNTDQAAAAVGKPSPFHFKWDDHALDTFKSGFKKSVGEVTVTNSFTTQNRNADQFTSWKPMTHANFGWNWNYHTNTTRNPQFKYTLPGMRGYVLLKNPYLKFLGGFNIKFQSRWDDKNPFATPPHVKLNATLEGNAYVNADLSLMADIYRDVTSDTGLTPNGGAGTPAPIPRRLDSKSPFGAFHIPLLNNFTKETHYFKSVHFFIANIPVVLQPGVSINLNAYHLGLFKGAVRLGINVHLLISATALYDSQSAEGMHMEFKAEALNVKMLPPTWMIYTKHLEFGALLTPTFWLRGGIGPIRDVTLEMQLKPYCNVSVTQEGEHAYGIQQQVMEKELVVMPFRAVNLQLGSEWSVGIEANGRRKMTSTELSMGVVEFNDYVEHFRFGVIDQRRLLREPIKVSLFKNGVQQMGKVVQIYCESVVEGECQPAPFNAEFYIDMKTVVVQLSLAWHADPVAYLMSKVRAMSFVFPQLALSREASGQYQQSKPESVFIKITRNGREYRAYQEPEVIHSHLVVIKTKKTQDLGLNWIDAWNMQYGTISGQKDVTALIDPSIELYYVKNGQEQLMAQTYLPNIDWSRALMSTSTQAKNQWLMGGSGVGRQGSSGFGGIDGALAGQEGANNANPAEVFQGAFFVGNIPIKIALASNQDQNTVFSTGHMGIDVHDPVRANRWLRPFRSEKFVQGSSHRLFWAIRNSLPGTAAQKFLITTWKVEPATGQFTATSMKMTVDGVCVPNDPEALRYQAYGKDCSYSQTMKVETGLVGATVVFELTFTDLVDETVHKMMSAPVTFVSVLPAATPAGNWGSWLRSKMSRKLTPQQSQDEWNGVPRKLSNEDGNVVEAPAESGKEMEFPMSELELQKDDEWKGHVNLAEEQKPRRLGEATAEARQLGAMYGYTPSNISFGAKMKELHPICTRKPLHYEIGAGVFFRAKVVNFHLTGGDQALGALTPIVSLIGMQHLDTHDIPLANTRLGKKLSKVFPKGLCTQGVCDGVLPGCPGQSAHTLVVPKVEFKLNRNFQWNDDTQKSAKTATAFAMALVPEMVRVTSLVITSMMHTTPKPGTQPASLNGADPNRFVGASNVIWVKDSPCRWQRPPDCANIFEYRGTDYQGCTIEDHDNRGWCSVGTPFAGNWRNCWLSCRNTQTGTHFTIKNLAKVNGKWGEKGTIAPSVPVAPVAVGATTLAPTVPLVTVKPTALDQSLVLGAHVKCTGTGDAALDGQTGTFIGFDGAIAKVNFGAAGLKMIPSVQCSRVNRRLATSPAKVEKKQTDPETDRFVVEIDPKALAYKVDEDLIQALIRRKAFRGMEDGREAELGEVQITHFRLHHGEDSRPGNDEGMIPVGPEEKFEWDSHTDYGDKDETPQATFPVASAVAGVAVLSIAGLLVAFYRGKQSQVLPYLSVSEPVE